VAPQPRGSSEQDVTSLQELDPGAAAPDVVIDVAGSVRHASPSPTLDAPLNSPVVGSYDGAGPQEAHIGEVPSDAARGSGQPLVAWRGAPSDDGDSGKAKKDKRRKTDKGEKEKSKKGKSEKADEGGVFVQVRAKGPPSFANMSTSSAFPDPTLLDGAPLPSMA
jgi:hypothetical protein